MVITRKNRWISLCLLLLMTALLLGASLVLPKLLRLGGARTPTLVITPVVCDIKAGPCISRHGDIAVRLAVNGAVIGSYQPLQFNVEVSGLLPDSVMIDFEGVDMFMGINRLELNQGANSIFSGIHELPGHAYPMTWRAKIIVRHGKQLIETGFEFELI